MVVEPESCILSQQADLRCEFLRWKCYAVVSTEYFSSASYARSAFRAARARSFGPPSKKAPALRCCGRKEVSSSELPGPACNRVVIVRIRLVKCV